MRKAPNKSSLVRREQAKVAADKPKNSSRPVKKSATKQPVAKKTPAKTTANKATATKNTAAKGAQSTAKSAQTTAKKAADTASNTAAAARPDPDTRHRRVASSPALVTPPFARGGPAGPRIRPGVRCCVPGPAESEIDWGSATSRYPRHVHVFVFESLVMTLAFFALMAVKVWAFVDALIRPAAAYVAAEKLTKPAWLLILGLTVVTSLLWPSLLGPVLDRRHGGRVRLPARRQARPGLGHPQLAVSGRRTALSRLSARFARCSTSCGSA